MMSSAHRGAPRGGYVYVVTARFPVDGPVAEWQRWYDEVHVPQMLSVPGVHGVRRYRDLQEADAFAAVYDIESPAVFADPRYQEVRGWGPWAETILEWRRDLLRREPIDAGAS